jgi:hypothetical protein
MKIAGRPANIAAGAPARDPGFVCCIPLFDGAAHSGSHSDIDAVVGDRLWRFVGWRTGPTPGGQGPRWMPWLRAILADDAKTPLPDRTRRLPGQADIPTDAMPQALACGRSRSRENRRRQSSGAHAPRQYFRHAGSPLRGERRRRRSAGGSREGLRGPFACIRRTPGISCEAGLNEDRRPTATIAAGAPAREPGFVCCIPLFDGAAHSGSYSDIDAVVGDRLRRFAGWRAGLPPGQGRGGWLGCVPHWRTM